MTLKFRKVKALSFARMGFGVGLLAAGLIRYVLAESIYELTVAESFIILMLMVVGVHFLHSGIATDLRDRIKTLEARMGGHQEVES